MKNQRGFGVLGIISLFVIVLILATIGLYVLRTNEPSTATPPKVNSAYTTITGTVVSVDLSAMEVDGDGVYKIKTNSNQDYSVHLTSGMSNCAIYKSSVPGAVIGDISKDSRVEVRGKSYGKTLNICDQGTYIKAL